jgi:iron complex transport system ATP-binding protein
MSVLALERASVERDGRTLVSELSLALRPQSLTVLVGPNGAGKSTMLRLLAGLWQPSAGRVTLDNQDIHLTERRKLAQRISFVPQDTHLSFAFTVREIVRMGRHPHLGRFEREKERDQRAIKDALERADVAHLSERLVTELSGGERQRVVIARSLATEAEIILLDEPTANLDVAHTLDVLNLCRELAGEGKTIVLALHDLNTAARYATQIALLSKGRIVAYGEPAHVLTDELIAAVFNVQTERAQIRSGAEVFLFRR